MKRLSQLFKSNRGEAMTFGLVISIVVLMIFFCVLTYSQLRITAAHVQTTAEQVLDTYTSTQGRNAIGSIKNGTNYTVALDQALYTTRLQEALGIGANLTGYDGSRVKFQITNVSLQYGFSNTINSSVTFTLREPLYFFGAEVTSMTGTVTVTSKYKIK